MDLLPRIVATIAFSLRYRKDARLKAAFTILRNPERQVNEITPLFSGAAFLTCAKL